MKSKNWVIKSENWVTETCKPNIAMSNFIYMIECCWCPFFESVPKSPYGGKPNEKQGPKTHQEDRRARKVQRKKCKGKRSTAKCRSATNYKFAAEYRFAAEYSSPAKWFWQIKANWAQDPFDPINIIWPTKAQIILYKSDNALKYILVICLCGRYLLITILNLYN